ncbi:peptidyl-prolyl cis-trans isomerase [Actinomycetes bacterium]|nr:peptidyl-prolyl cis-trans isomerase [Actinomycetes bacterium]
MGTSKRERQKKNREARREQVTRRQQQGKARKRGSQVGVVVLLVVALVGFVFVTGNNSNTDVSETETESTQETVDTTQDTVAAQASMPFEYGTSACPPIDGSAEQRREFTDSHQLCIDPAKTYVATFDTTQGSFSVRLLSDRAPGTVNNFVSLARWKYFDGTKCHRVIEDFVVQCGDPTATGTGGPGYSFADELPQAGEYKIGSLAMANSGPNTNGSQFFVITGNSGASLPPSYSLFGEVVDGLDTAVKAMGALFNPDPAANGVPPAGDIVLKSVTISES